MNKMKRAFKVRQVMQSYPLLSGILLIDGVNLMLLQLYTFQVAIQMHPLNAKEANANYIWCVLPQYNLVTQTTSTGQPLQERVN
jgi:hypothetical protein